ncbi:MAG: hypothetical protein JWQ81_1646 [Amycolatopsis sp.]|nr:hypothetical protein [Amycolatopsis sp.]
MQRDVGGDRLAAGGALLRIEFCHPYTYCLKEGDAVAVRVHLTASVQLLDDSCRCLLGDVSEHKDQRLDHWSGTV